MKKVILLILCFYITGCAWAFNKHDQLPQYVLIAPNDSMLLDCKYEPPPQMDVFMKGDTVNQLYLMTEAYNKQTKNLSECSIRLYEIKIWKEEQLKNYNKP